MLDLACGHGRYTREFSRRGARAVGVDVSQRLIAAAEESERDRPLGVQYLRADASLPGQAVRDASLDVVVCGFGLSDIDDLDGALATVARTLRAGGPFVFSILHPCFPGAGEVSGAWPPDATYYEERRWSAGGVRSTLGSRVGANHRMLATYVNAMTGQGLHVDTLAEPLPPAGWHVSLPDAARHPVFLVGACIRSSRLTISSRPGAVSSAAVLL